VTRGKSKITSRRSLKNNTKKKKQGAKLEEEEKEREIKAVFLMESWDTGTRQEKIPNGEKKEASGSTAPHKQVEYPTELTFLTDDGTITRGKKQGLRKSGTKANGHGSGMKKNSRQRKVSPEI